MKLVTIYGPPAVGKLTTAKSLSEITGFKVFHNHLTDDLLIPFFGLGSDYMHNLNMRFRLEILEGFANQEIDAIFTHCYIHPDKRNVHPSTSNFINQLTKNVEKYNGRLLFVRLFCDIERLYERVTRESRKVFTTKDKTIGDLEKSLKINNLTSEIPFVDGFSIDNTALYPNEVAQMIKEHYQL